MYRMAGGANKRYLGLQRKLRRATSLNKRIRRERATASAGSDWPERVLGEGSVRYNRSRLCHLERDGLLLQNGVNSINSLNLLCSSGAFSVSPDACRCSDAMADSDSDHCDSIAALVQSNVT